MPPKKKVIKKAGTGRPVGRPPSRRSVSASNTVPEEAKTPVVSEKDVTPCVETPVATEKSEKEKGVVETPVIAAEENDKGAGFVETPVVAAEESEEVAETQGVAVEKKDKGAIEVEALGCEKEDKGASFVGTPVVGGRGKLKGVNIYDTPVVAGGEKDNDKDKVSPFVQTPVFVDKKNEQPTFETPDTMADEVPETSAGPPAVEQESAVTEEVAGKPVGVKKVVKVLKKVKKVVVKKKIKVAKKEEERVDDAAVIDGGAGDEEEKELEPAVATIDEADTLMEGTNVVSDDNAEKHLVMENLELDPGASVADTLIEENNDASDTNAEEQTETKDLQLESGASLATPSGEALPEQEMKMEEEEPCTIENEDASEKVLEEKNKEENVPALEPVIEDEEAAMSERRRRRKTEIFIGGLDRDAKEEDIKKVFGKVGEIVEVRMMMDGQTGKNKGYAFLRYALASQAKQAVSEFAKVEVCGKLCGAAALEGNDTIFLGNIDKKWTKEDLLRLSQEIGVEKIDTVTVVSDPSNAGTSRGFAFLEFETNRDAQMAYKKLQKKDVFGKGQNIKVAWATPLNETDEEEMQKVKSVFAESVPPTWDEKKVKECFKKFGDIERVVLSRNIQSSKRKDFAFVNYITREAALLCIESFDKEEIIENGSKVNIKVSLAKPLQKTKQNKIVPVSGNKGMPKERFKGIQRDPKLNTSSSKSHPFKTGYRNTGVDRKTGMFSSDQPAWRQDLMNFNRGPAVENYSFVPHGEKRPYGSLGNPPYHSDSRGYPRARTDFLFPAANPSPLPNNTPGTSMPYYQQPNVGYGTGAYYGPNDTSGAFQPRYGNAPPYGSNRHPRY